MKKIKLTGKLSLNKETITKLNDDQMNQVEGGATVMTQCDQVTCNIQTNSCIGCPSTSYPNTCSCG